ncbi:MAG: hypothetical protein B5766_12000 [Candidatus Lumbricidophila eiseniae]|uniref:Uncharacterized protein n=1 Tax=Candidatus Lumbricidiphila eiseniae TaxID=1969409 RepID=A0A2A6FNW0_9MICO|nr:MAG: hypothetical protein B5766_12000 [Candidatus Lumbricidophila eiseniae]
MIKRHKILETVGLSNRREALHTLGLTKDPEASFLENFGGAISCLGGVALLLTGSENWVLCLCFVVIGVALTQFAMIRKSRKRIKKDDPEVSFLENLGVFLVNLGVAIFVLGIVALFPGNWVTSLYFIALSVTAVLFGMVMKKCKRIK